MSQTVELILAFSFVGFLIFLIGFSFMKSSGTDKNKSGPTGFDEHRHNPGSRPDID